MRLTADRRAARRESTARDAPPLQRSAMDDDNDEDGLRSDEIAARRDQLALTPTLTLTVTVTVTLTLILTPTPAPTPTPTLTGAAAT